MRALLSVADKTGLTELAEALAARGVKLISTGGTAAALGAAGLHVSNVSDITGFPEMMDGRVKTLHPKIHGGILARRREAPDLAAAAAHAIPLIDIVVVNLYPFGRAAADPATAFDELVEQIDIGGPSLVRAAAKNFSDVLVVVDAADYPLVIRELDREGGPTLAFRFELARKAFAHTAQYDAAIARTLAGIRVDGDRMVRGEPPTVPGVGDLTKIRDLRYGENPHQTAAWYATGAGVGFSAASVLQGKELSYTNLLDLDAAVRIALEFDEPAAVVIKHTNPCGAATGRSAADAYIRAREADSMAAFGGIAGLNRPIDEDTAKAITSTFMEAVVAPAVDATARPILAGKPNLRVVVLDFGRAAAARQASPIGLRSILGALLVQDADSVREARAPWPPPGEAEGLRVVTRRAPTPEEWTALRFAWRISAHVKSNAIVFADATSTLAIGAGQMSRVDAVRVAVMKAEQRPGLLKGSVAASDAFFPFRDGLDAIADAGATAVAQPGGSMRDTEVIAAADERGLAMVFTGKRHFKH